MARPSQNIDQRLLAAGMELLPQTGCRALSARKLTEHAGVNLGMFHYHFKSKDNFIRILLDQVYEQMFAVLVLKSRDSGAPLDKLRTALQLLGQFGRERRQLLRRIFGDALAGEQVAIDFLQANVPRHLAVIAGLIGEAQRAGDLVDVPLPQAIAFLAGAIMSPVLLGTAALDSGMLPAAASTMIEHEVLSRQAIEERIEFALRGLAVPKRRTR